jgi:hypothetical protein
MKDTKFNQLWSLDLVEGGTTTCSTIDHRCDRGTNYYQVVSDDLSSISAGVWGCDYGRVSRPRYQTQQVSFLPRPAT